jgi:hypothetical protein
MFRTFSSNTDIRIRIYPEIDPGVVPDADRPAADVHKTPAAGRL